MKKWIVFPAIVVVVLAGGLWFGLRSVTPNSSQESGAVVVKVQIEGVKERAELFRNADGSYVYVISNESGGAITLSPNEFAARMYQQELPDNFLAYLFNISTPAGIAWVTFGLLGQVMFSARMIVQWIVSEKRKISIVPPVFWWLSIAGAIMLFTYFVWRRDIVGMLGQGSGLAIYLRNIYFIYRAPCPSHLSHQDEVTGQVASSAVKS